MDTKWNLLKKFPNLLCKTYLVQNPLPQFHSESTNKNPTFYSNSQLKREIRFLKERCRIHRIPLHLLLPSSHTPTTMAHIFRCPSTFNNPKHTLLQLLLLRLRSFNSPLHLPPTLLHPLLSLESTFPSSSR